MKNNIIKIQEMLMEEMEIIKSLDLKNGLTNREIERSKALSCGAVNYMKAINTQLRIREYADAKKMELDKLQKELGV